MADTFKLVIDIRGLCLLVPHEGKLHVLLPQSHRGMEHIAFFKFKGNRPREEFDGVRWDLSGVGGGFTRPLPPAVVDAATYIRKEGLPLSQLVPGRQQAVSSHLILGGGRCTARGNVAHWKIGGDRMVPMTSKIRLEIDNVPDEMLAWKFEALTGQARTPKPLEPRGANRVVELDLMHAPPKEHDQPDDVNGPCKSNWENHFHMYWPLFPTNLGHQPECEFGADVLPDADFAETDPGADKERHQAKFDWGPSVFTCMLAQTTKVHPTT